MAIVIAVGVILGVIVAAMTIITKFGAVVAWFGRRKDAPPPAPPTSAHQDETNRLLGEIVAALSQPSKPQFDAEEMAAQAAEEIEEQLESLLPSLANDVTPPTALSPNTSALAAETTSEAKRSLTKVMRLIDQGRYRDAIEHVLSAYDRELPPLARAQLHVVAGNGFHGLSDYGAAEMHYREALHAAPSAAAKVIATGNLGLVFAERGDLKTAEEYHRKALDITKETGDKLGQAEILGNLGLVYARRGDLEGAEESYRRALEIYEEIGDRLGQARQLGNLGGVYARRGDEGAEESFRKALNIHEEIGNKLGQARQLANLGLVHARRDEPDNAEKYFRKALGITEEIGNRLAQAHQLGNIGNLYAKRGDLEGAEEYHRKALEIDKEIGYRLGQAQALGSLGGVHALHGDVEGAEESYRSALEVAEEVGAKRLVSELRDLLEKLKTVDD